MSDGDENYRAEGGGGQADRETAAEDSEFHEDPAAEDGADQAEDDVGDAAVAAAAGNFSGEPAGDQADDDPADQAALRIRLNDDAFLKKVSEKRASMRSPDGKAGIKIAFDAHCSVAARKYQLAG